MLVMVNGVEREDASVDTDGVGVRDDNDDGVADDTVEVKHRLQRGPLGRAMGVWSCNQGRGRTAVRPAAEGTAEAMVMGRQGEMGMGMARYGEG